MERNEETFIRALKDDLLNELPTQTHEIQGTIETIFKQYNLRTDLDFVEKIGKINFNKDGEVLALEDIPQELTDAAFIPPNAISDIALRNDIDLIISQVPEKFACIKVTTDAICESDTVDGSISRQLLFQDNEYDDDILNNKIKTVETFEEKLELQDIIKNHIVRDALTYGEGYLYTVPYAKVFSDLYEFKIKDHGRTDKTNASSLNLNATYGNHQRLNTIRVGESANNPVEVVLSETYEMNPTEKGNRNIGVFTESEVMELYPSYNAPVNKMPIKERDHNRKYKTYIEESIKEITDRISFVGENHDIALPVLEESVHDMLAVYDEKYKNQHKSDVGTVKTFFESVMEQTMDRNYVDSQFEHIKGVYLKVLPATKLIPIRIDRNVVGYYYISDGTRPEEAGQRKNSGLSGYAMRSSTIGYDNFSPDRQMCERLATKIINNFDMKFMRNNTALHDQIVSILQAHRFNDALMRFIFIPAEHVHKFAINKDGNGKGHSMLEPGLVTSRMYMFLKMYCLLFQINNSAIRVYNIRSSGIDKNYKQYVQETMRKFIARRITPTDIFNYKNSMSRISGGSELVMHMGTSDTPPITIDKIEAADSPLNQEFLDSLKTESINADSVPSLMITDKLHDIDFAAEIKEANARFFSMVGGYKIDLNPSVTRLYHFIMKWETDLTEDDIRIFKFTFKTATKQQLAVTAEMIASFNSELDLLTKFCLTPSEAKPNDGEELSDTAREFGKLLIAKRLPDINMEEMMELAEKARSNAVKKTVDEKKDDSGNMMDDLPEANGEELLM